MYFDTEEVKDHIRCMNNKDVCANVDYKKCGTMGLNTVEFETCMIQVVNSVDFTDG